MPDVPGPTEFALVDIEAESTPLVVKGGHVGPGGLLGRVALLARAGPTAAGSLATHGSPST